MIRRPPSFLHLQMGQEVIYLLLTSSILASIILATIALKREAEPEPPLLPDLGGRPAPPPSPIRLSEPDAPTRDDQPPIIALQEADGYFFASGSAELTADFREKLTAEVVPRLREIGRRYRADIVEVIGHTDGLPLRQGTRGQANLDAVLPDLVAERSATAPVPHDNVGLGMARALAVALVLRRSGLGESFDILPLSAGPLIAPGDRLLPADIRRDDRERRRIEIRLRRRRLSDP